MLNLRQAASGLDVPSAGSARRVCLLILESPVLLGPGVVAPRRGVASDDLVESRLRPRPSVVLVLGGRDQADLAVQASVVEPVEVHDDGDLASA